MMPDRSTCLILVRLAVRSSVPTHYALSTGLYPTIPLCRLDWASKDAARAATLAARFVVVDGALDCNFCARIVTTG